MNTSFHSSFAIRHCLLSLLLAPCTLLPAAPPPELTVLRTQYDKVVAERVTAPFDAALTDLNTKFISALKRTAGEVKKTGNLEAVLAINADKTRLAGKLPIPDDDDQTPDALKKLRGIYRAQLTKIEDQRGANHGTILPGYTDKLKALEATLTKADRIDEAKEVKDYREGLVLGIAATTGTPARDPAPETERTAATKTKYPKGDDRKAAEWVLGVGGSVSLSVDRKEVIADDAQALPRGKFELTKVRLKFFQGRQPTMPVTDLLPLAGLQSLAEIDTAGLKTLADEHLAVLSSLPALRLASFATGALTDAAFAQIARAPALTTVHLTEQAGITGAGLGALAKLDSLVHLNLAGCSGLGEEGFAALAQLRQLGVLFLDSTSFSDAHLPLLDGMKKLHDLQVKNTAVTMSGIAGRKSLAGLKVLAISLGTGDGAGQAGTLAKACPALDNLIITGKKNATLTTEDIAALSAFPKLTKLMFYAPGFTEASLTGLSALPKLQNLSFGYLKFTDACLPPLVAHKGLHQIVFGEAQITDEGLLSLTKMKGLEQLNLKGCPKLTADGIAAFKKARPDVKVEK